MQAAVSICIIGPIADRNGEIEVRRYVVLVVCTLSGILIIG